MTVKTVAINMIIAIHMLAFTSIPVAAELLVTNATVRLLPPGVPNTSAYFTIENTGPADEFLVAAEATFAKKAELHAHIMDGDMMRMEQQHQVLIPAGQSVTFKPGGLHVMIFGLLTALQENQQADLSVITKSKQRIEINATVVMPGDENSHHQHQHH